MVVTDLTEYLDELLTGIAKNHIEEVKKLLTSEELERRIQKGPGRSWMGDDGVHMELLTMGFRASTEMSLALISCGVKVKFTIVRSPSSQAASSSMSVVTDYKKTTLHYLMTSYHQAEVVLALMPFFVKFYECGINDKDINGKTPLEAYIDHYQRFKANGVHKPIDVIRIIARAKVLGATLPRHVVTSINSALESLPLMTDSAAPATYDSLVDADLENWNHDGLEEWLSYLGKPAAEELPSRPCVIS